MKKRKRSILTTVIATIIMLGIVGGAYYVCHLAMHAVPYEYLKPTASVMLFVLLLNSYGATRSDWKKKHDETKDKE